MSKDDIAIVRDIVVLAAIMLFASGWMATYFFFQHFGFSLNELDWPYHAFYMYSLLPLSSAWRIDWPLGILLVISASSIWLYFNFPKLRIASALVTVVALLFWLYPLAWEAAQAEAECVRRGAGKTIQFVLDPKLLHPQNTDRPEEVDALVRGLTSNTAILLAETGTHYFVLFQAELEEAAPRALRRAPVFRVPSDMVVLARTTAKSLPLQSELRWGLSCEI